MKSTTLDENQHLSQFTCVWPLFSPASPAHPFPGQATPTLWAGPQALRAQAMGSYFADLRSSGYVQKSSISLGTPHDCRLHSLDQHGPR